MSEPTLALLRDCNGPAEAESLRTRLEAAGIFAVVTNADIYTTFSYIGTAMGGVRVQVAAEDLPRAEALLEADRQALMLAHPWSCSRCDEQNEPSFELCWYCGRCASRGDGFRSDLQP